MDVTLRDRANRSATQLPGWLIVSVVSHVLILAAGIGAAPPPTPLSASFLTIEIARPQTEAVQASATAAVKSPVTVLQPMTAATPQPRADTVGPATRKGPLPIENYFQMAEVDVRAEPINDVLLQYPWLAYVRRLAGVVRFALYINAEGGLDRVELIEANPSGYFEEAAMEAASKLQFSPARKNGQPVKSKKTIEVVFDPNEDFATPPVRPQGFSAAGT